MKTKSHRSKDTLSSLPDNEVVIGKIYANWCGHCKNMGDGFKQVGNIVISKYSSDAQEKSTYKSSGGRKSRKNIKMVEIEESEKDKKLSELNSRYFSGSDKVKCDGYPTVFIISGGNIKYYNGNTNFTDPVEGEKNKISFQKWLESNIDTATPQNGGGCGCRERQSGGWRWSAKNASQTRSRKKSQTRSRSGSRLRSRTRSATKKSTIYSNFMGVSK